MTLHLRYLDRRDEQKRYCGTVFYLHNKPQIDLRFNNTDGFSYLGARDFLIKGKIEMGFNCSEDNFVKYVNRNLKNRILEGRINKFIQYKLRELI